MPLVQTSPPAIEPIDIGYINMRGRVIENTEDTLVTMMIAAARRHAESVTGRSFITQSWKLSMDAFPGGCGMGFAPYGQVYSWPENAILLDKGDVQSIDSIGYLAMDGTTQTMPIANYIADLSGNPARITPVFGQIWPINMPQIASAWVNYTAGYGLLATNVPEGIRDWIAMRVGTIFENREEVAIVTKGKVDPLPWIDSLLDPYTVITA